MAKHRKARSHTVLGGVLLGATLSMAAPAALASPHRMMWRHRATR